MNIPRVGVISWHKCEKQVGRKQHQVHRSLHHGSATGAERNSALGAAGRRCRKRRQDKREQGKNDQCR